MSIYDIVMLKSGGPPMVILDEDQDKYLCKWNQGHHWFYKITVVLFP